jgi:probable phosphoglycerate mutase
VEAIETLNAEHEKESIAVVSHADVIKLVLAHYLGMHLDHYQRLRVAPASVSVVHLAAKGPPQVIRMNDDGPLRPRQQPAETTDEEE